jgi:hypothetical protein
MLVALWPISRAAGFESFAAFTTLENAAAATGGGFLEIANANVSDPLMPPMTDAIQSITFSGIPEPTSAALALVAMLGLLATILRVRRQTRRTA